MGEIKKGDRKKDGGRQERKKKKIRLRKRRDRENANKREKEKGRDREKQIQYGPRKGLEGRLPKGSPAKQGQPLPPGPLDAEMKRLHVPGAEVLIKALVSAFPAGVHRLSPEPPLLHKATERGAAT